MKAILLLFAAFGLLGQSLPLTPAADFDLNSEVIRFETVAGGTPRESKTAESAAAALYRTCVRRAEELAATDFLYLLSSNEVLKTDSTGTVLGTYRLRLGRNFRPATLGVTGDDLYLMDNTGRVEQFLIQ